MTFDPNFKGVSLFVDVDEYGEITNALQSVTADRQYNFFFFVEQSVAESLSDYKVVVNGFVPQLTLKG